MISVTPPDWEEITRRWHQATVANHLLKWHAISYWLASISMMCTVDAMPEAAESMRVLSDLALQHSLDLQPERELQAA